MCVNLCSTFNIYKTYTLCGESFAKPAKEEKKWWKRTLTTLVENTEDIKDTNKGHASGWRSIFGKKGLITGAAMILIPLMIDIFKDPMKNLANFMGNFLGIGDNTDGKRTDASGNVVSNDDVLERIAMAGAKIGSGAMKSADNIRKLLGGEAVEANKFETGIAKAIQKGKSIGTKFANTTFGSKVVGAGSATGDMISTFSKEAVKAIKNADAWLTSKVRGIDNKAIRGILNALLAVVESPATLGRFSGKIAKTFASGALTIGAGLGTGGVATVVFGTYGAITGFSDAETAKLFGISKGDVTTGMKAISSIVKAFFSTGWFFLLDIANDICVSVTGFDAIRAIVDLIYATFTDKESVEKLQASRSNFEAGHAQYVDLASQLGIETDISLDAYSDKVNRGFFGKVTDTAGKGFDMTKRFFFGNKGDTDKYQQALDLKAKLENMDASVKETEAYKQLVKDNEEALANYATSENILVRMGDTASKAFSSVSNFFKDTFEEIGKAGTEIIGYSEVDAIPLGSMFTTGKPTDTGIIGGIKTAMFYVIRGFLSIGKVFSAGLDIAGKALGKVVDGGKAVVNTVSDFAGNTVDKVKSGAASMKEKGSNFLGNVKNTASNIWSGVKSFFSGEGGVGGEVQSNMLSRYNVTSNFGKRNLTGEIEGHSGIDLNGGKNFPVESFTAGKVVKVVNMYKPDTGSLSNRDGGGFGNHVIVQNDDNTFSYYAHLNKVAVSNGDTVSPGQIIGLQGHTGRSTGSHLHYEVRQSRTKGTSIDPVVYLKNYKTGVPYTPGDTANTEFTTGTLDTGAGLSGYVSYFGDVLSQITAPMKEIVSKFRGVLSGILGEKGEKTDSDGPSPGILASIGNRIGDAVKQFESGSSGSSTISSGKGDYGGVSFGTYQFPTYGKAKLENGSLVDFWNSISWSSSW